MMRRKLFVGVSLLAVFGLSCPASAGTKYSYDSAGRLIQAEYASGVTIRYSYDAAGNRRAITTTQLPNRAPVAVNDSASGLTSSAVDIQVRANDSDPDRNPITITSVSAVTGGGAAVIMGGGAYIRFTAPSTTGTKTFTYTISDGKGGAANLQQLARQAQKLQNALGVIREGFQFLIGIGGIRKLDQLHLVELMLTDQAAGIAPCGTGLSTEAGGIRTVFDWQAGAFQNLAAVHIGYRNLRRWNKVQIIHAYVVHLPFFIRQLPCTKTRSLIYQMWHLHFPVTCCGRLV